MWMQAIRSESSMFHDKRTVSRVHTSAQKRRWTRSLSEGQDRANSTSASSNINAVATTPDIAVKAPVHTRGLTPENKVQN